MRRFPARLSTSSRSVITAHSQIDQTKEKLGEKVITQLEEKVDVLKARIVMLEETNEQLCQVLARHPMPAIEENRGTTN